MGENGQDELVRDPGEVAGQRDKAMRRLAEACGSGRLTLAEFSRRTRSAREAGSEAVIQSLTSDLPAAGGPVGPATSWRLKLFSGFRVRGPWQMPRNAYFVSIIGGADLDFSEARVASPEVTVTKIALIGGIHLRVPDGVNVTVSGFRLQGGTHLEPGLLTPSPGAPTIRIRGYALNGGIRISRLG